MPRVASTLLCLLLVACGTDCKQATADLAQAKNNLLPAAEEYSKIDGGDEDVTEFETEIIKVYRQRVAEYNAAKTAAKGCQ